VVDAYTMPTWNVYIFFHGDEKRNRSIRRVGHVEAVSAMRALGMARTLVNGMKFRKRFGGLDVRRADLMSLTKMMAEEEKKRHEHGSTGWQQRFGKRRSGRPSKEVSAALKRNRESCSEVGEDWSGFDSETAL
jgi:hypothetical protein